MASSFALLKNATAASNLLNKFIHPIRFVSVAPSSLRSFNRSSELRDSSDDEEELEMVGDRRSDSVASRRGYAANVYPKYVLDPFAPPRSLYKILDAIDNYNRNPFVASEPRGERGGSAVRRSWNAVEDEDALYLRIDMPGLGKEHVKVFVEKNKLVINGEGVKEDDEEEDVRRYNHSLDLPVDLFKIGEIKAEMKNGVLRVSIPKVKKDEKKDVLEVNVQ